MHTQSLATFAGVIGLSVIAAAAGASCGGSDTVGGGGSAGASSANTGSGAHTEASSGGSTHHGSTGTGGTSSGHSSSSSGGSSGHTTGSMASTGGGGSGGGIDTGSLDCSAPTGATPALKLTHIASVNGARFLDIKVAPTDKHRIFVLDENGYIRVIKDGTLETDPFLDIHTLVLSDNSEQGFLGFAFHPDYAQNGRFFVYYSSVNAGLMTVAEYARGADADHAKPNATQILLTQDTFETNHNGGAMSFSPLDHMLYIGWGDGGGANDQHGMCGHGQDKQILLGKILRLDVDHTTSTKPYKPAGMLPGALPEIWDYGLRNPWRFSFDGCNGDLFIGDVGQNTHEEIDHEAAGMGGKNYGWRCMEGDEVTPGVDETGCDCSGPFVAPLVSFDRNTASTIIGGYVYRGSAIPGLRGKYVFGDAAVNQIWVLDPANNYAFQADGMANDHFGNGTLGDVVGFGQDLDGELYVADLTGIIWRIDAQ